MSRLKGEQELFLGDGVAEDSLQVCVAALLNDLRDRRVCGDEVSMNDGLRSVAEFHVFPKASNNVLRQYGTRCVGAAEQDVVADLQTGDEVGPFCESTSAHVQFSRVAPKWTKVWYNDKEDTY